MTVNDPSDPFSPRSLLYELGVQTEPFFNDLFLEKAHASPRFLTPWNLIRELPTFFTERTSWLERRYQEILPSVWVSRGVRIHGTVTLAGPLLLEEDVEVLEGAILGGPLYVGKKAHIGRETEVRSSVLCAEARLEDGCVVLDSIVGKGAVLEEGVVTLTRGKREGPLSIEFPPGRVWHTTFHRLGSYLYPRARVSRNERLNPGTIRKEVCPGDVP